MKSKPTIILLHGALGTRKQVEVLMPFLELEFEVHAMEFDGHGARSSDESYSMDSFAQQVTLYMGRSEINSAHFFGYSLGGYVALTLAKNQPEKVLSITTLGTKFNWTPETAAKEVIMLNPDKMEKKIPTFVEFLKNAHSGNNWKAVIKRTADLMIDLGNGTRLTNIDLSKIQTPALICVGSEDNMVTTDESEQLAKHLPYGLFKIIEGFYHPFEKNDPQIMADIIVQHCTTGIR